MKLIKHSAFLFFLLLANLPVWGNVKFTSIVHWYNSQVDIEDGDYISTEKPGIILQAIEKLNRKLGNDSIYIHIRFDYGSVPYRIAYSNSRYAVTKKFAGGYELLKNEKVYKTINLYCTERQYKLNDIVKLLYYALDHYGESKEPNIHSILKQDYPALSKVFNAKYYSRPEWWWNDRISHRIEYYVQNGEYYIYKAQPVNPPKRTLWEVYNDTAGIFLFKANNVFNILSSGDNDDFVFTSDTTMYHIIYDKTIVKGPYYFKIPDFLDNNNWFNDAKPIIKIRPGLFEFTVANLFGDYKLWFNASKGRFFLKRSSISPRLWEEVYYEVRHNDKKYKSGEISGDEKKKRTNHMLVLAAIVGLSTVILASNKKL